MVNFAYMLFCENEDNHTSFDKIFGGLLLEFCGEVPLNQPNIVLL